MTTKYSLWIHRFYSILFCLFLAIAALCLMGACLEIYDSGNGVFTREAVAAAFSPIAPMVYGSIFLALLGFPLHWFLPRETKKKKAGMSQSALLLRLRSQTDLDSCSTDLKEAMAKHQRSRIRHRVISLVLMGITALAFLVYVLTGDRFLLPDITTSMKHAMAVLLPCLAVTFGYSIFAHYRGETALAAEIDLMKQAKKAFPALETKATVEVQQNPALLRWAILLLAVAILLFGYFTGGTADVLTKAINICTECVGLG